jgi:hypothetical protein
VTVESFVLDSSALLTLIEDEAGADRVEDVPELSALAGQQPVEALPYKAANRDVTTP